MAKSQWETQDSNKIIPINKKYSPDEFYTGGKYGREETQVTSFRVPVRLKHELDTIIAKRFFSAYDTATRFWLDAAVHRLQQLTEMENDPAFKNKVTLITEEIRLSRLAAEEAAYEKTIRYLMDRLDKSRNFPTVYHKVKIEVWKLYKELGEDWPWLQADLANKVKAHITVEEWDEGDEE